MPKPIESEPTETPLKGLGFSKDLPDEPRIEDIRRTNMPAELRPYHGRQFCKICLSGAAKNILELAKAGIPNTEIARWLTEGDANGIVYNDSNVFRHIRHARRNDPRIDTT
jgi:hypothetical protein